MLHTYEKSALACEVIERKNRHYNFRDYSAKCIVVRILKMDIRDARFKTAVAYTQKCIDNITVEV